MPNIAEQECYDAQFPDHPLSRLRRFHARIEASLQFDAQANFAQTPKASTWINKFLRR